MKYILLDYVYEAGWPQLTPEQQKTGLAAYMAYMEAMKQAGVLKDSVGLSRTESATTLRMKDGKLQVLDGPYTDTKEQLGGFHLIEVENLDEAIKWASRAPTVHYGAMEIRPVNELSLAEISERIDA